jgi:hypothetical protein
MSSQLGHVWWEGPPVWWPVWLEGPPGHTVLQQWEGPLGHPRCETSLDRGVNTAGEGFCSVTGSGEPREGGTTCLWGVLSLMGGVGRIGGTAMAALCVPSEWLRTTVGLRAAYCHICVGNVTTSCNVDGAAETCVIWRRGDRDDAGGAHGRSSRLCQRARIGK